MDNHRKNERHACQVSVEGKAGSVFDQTQTIDFSKGGVGFVSRHRIPVSKEIPMELDLAMDGEPVLVIGRVQWVRRISNSKHYRIGVAFKNVMQGSKSRLNQYFRDIK